MGDMPVGWTVEWRCAQSRSGSGGSRTYGGWVVYGGQCPFWSLLTFIYRSGVPAVVCGGGVVRRRRGLLRACRLTKVTGMVAKGGHGTCQRSTEAAGTQGRSFF